jgi:hypothetical protein
MIGSSASLLPRLPELMPLVSLTGVVLDALGGLYLAYDLLGGKHGPLRMLTRLLTYSAIFGLGYGATLGLWFGLTGALVQGPTVEYQLSRRAQGIKPSTHEWALMAALRGLSFGTAGGLEVGYDFGVIFGLLSTLVMHTAYEFGFGTNIYRSFQRPRMERPMVVGGIVRGILIGLAGIISGALTRRPEALLHGIQIGIVVGMMNMAVTILSPSVEWWADNLPDRALGGYGAVLVLIGSAMQTVQYVAPLISLRTM